MYYFEETSISHRAPKKEKTANCTKECAIGVAVQDAIGLFSKRPVHYLENTPKSIQKLKKLHCAK